MCVPSKPTGFLPTVTRKTPGSLSARARLADSLFQTACHDEARTLYEAPLAKAPTDPQEKARMTLAFGDSLVALRSGDEAERLYRDISAQATATPCAPPLSDASPSCTTKAASLKSPHTRGPASPLHEMTRQKANRAGC